MILLNDICYQRGRGARAAKLNHFHCEFNRENHAAILIGHPPTQKALIRIITGSLAPEDGYCHKKGRVSWPLYWLPNFMTGTLTCVENIAFVSRLYGYKPSEIRAFVEEFSGLGGKLRKPFNLLGRGDRYKFFF